MTPRRRSRPATVVAFSLFAAMTASGCMLWSTGFSFQDSRRFQQRPGGTVRVTPIAKIDETLWGLSLFGFQAKAIDPQSLRQQYLANPRYRVVNWQIVSGNLDIPYVDFLMIFPYCRVSFDVVEVEEMT